MIENDIPKRHLLRLPKLFSRLVWIEQLSIHSVRPTSRSWGLTWFVSAESASSWEAFCRTSTWPSSCWTSRSCSPAILPVSLSQPGDHVYFLENLYSRRSNRNATETWVHSLWVCIPYPTQGFLFYLSFSAHTLFRIFLLSPCQFSAVKAGTSFNVLSALGHYMMALKFCGRLLSNYAHEMWESRRTTWSNRHHLLLGAWSSGIIWGLEVPLAQIFLLWMILAAIIPPYHLLELNQVVRSAGDFLNDVFRTFFTRRVCREKVRPNAAG